MEKKYLIITLSIALLLGGCASKPAKPVVVEDNYEKLIFEQREILKQNIMDVSRKAYNVQKTISEVQNAMALKSTDFSPEVMRYKEWQNTYIPVGMEREMTIDWKAYPEEMLKLLASASSYEIEFIGKAYPIARMINISPDPRPIKKLIDNVEMQSKGYIERVDIFEESKLIKVYYELH